MTILKYKEYVNENLNEAKYSAKKEEEDLFKLWDKIVGDKRKGIYTHEPSGLNFRQSDSSQFVLNVDPPEKMDKWIEEVEKLAKKKGWKYFIEVSNPWNKFLTITDK